jgi:hypothetical protein
LPVVVVVVTGVIVMFSLPHFGHFIKPFSFLANKSYINYLASHKNHARFPVISRLFCLTGDAVISDFSGYF